MEHPSSVIESYLPKSYVPVKPTFFESNGPFDGIKRDDWKGGVRMPTIATWPGHIPVGKVVTNPSISYDWAPTFLDAAGVAAPVRMDGVSLLPSLTGRTRKADKKVKTIAGRLVRELERKLPPNVYQNTLVLFKKVLAQKKSDTGKIYSLHEPHVACISKGKEHKKYEFGSKVSVITTKNSGVIIGAINIEKNVHDSKTLQPSIEQQQRLTGIILKNNFVDRGYRGVKEVLGTKIIIPDSPVRRRTNYEKQKLRKGFKRRACSR